MCVYVCVCVGLHMCVYSWVYVHEYVCVRVCACDQASKTGSYRKTVASEVSRNPPATYKLPVGMCK